MFTRRAVNQEKTAPVRFGEDANQFSLRKRNDDQIVGEFQHQGSIENITLPTLQLLEFEILAQYALHRAFESVSVPVPSHLPSAEGVSAAQFA